MHDYLIMQAKCIFQGKPEIKHYCSRKQWEKCQTCKHLTTWVKYPDPLEKMVTYKCDHKPRQEPCKKYEEITLEQILQDIIC